MQQVYFLEHPFHFLFPHCGLYPQIHQGEFHIFVYGQFIDQVKALEDESQISFAKGGQLILTHLVHLFSLKKIRAGSRRIESAQNIQQSGLATTGRSHDRYKFSLFYLHGHFVQGFGLHLFSGEEHR